MLHALVLGVITGIVLALPPGPLAVAVIKQGLVGHRSAGRQVAAAAAVMDCLYALLAASASSALVVALTDRVLANSGLVLAFQGLCIIGLTLIGVRYLRQPQPAKDTGPFCNSAAAPAVRPTRRGPSSPFLLGGLLALTNLALPTFLPSLIGVIGYLHTRGWLSTTLTARAAFALGFGGGTSVWLLTLLHGVLAQRTKFNGTVISAIYRVAGATFLVSAVGLAIDVGVSLDWAPLFASVVTWWHR